MATDFGLQDEDFFNDWLWYDVPDMPEFSEVFK